MVARSRALRVVRAIARNGQTALVARRPVAAGETVLRLAGNIVAVPTRYTLQLGEDQHIEPPLVSWWTSCSSMYCASRGTRIAMSLAMRNRWFPRDWELRL